MASVRTKRYQNATMHRFTLFIIKSKPFVTTARHPFSSVLQQKLINSAIMIINKRKMKEVEVSTKIAGSVPQINLNFEHGHQFASPNIVPFKSFASLLADGKEEDDLDTPLADIKNQREQIDQIITFHCDTLRHSLAGALHRKAEERASKKLKEKDLELEAKMTESMELEKMVEDYKAEAESLKSRVLYLEQTKESLRLSLKDVIAARRYAANVEEDAESSIVDPGRVGPVRLGCKVCGRRLATVMVWPCRHVCVCTGCDAAAKACPVCGTLKTTSVEVRLPIN